MAAKAKKATRSRAKKATAKTTAKAKKATAKKAGVKSTSPASVSKVHTLHEDHPWTIDYAGHPARKDSELYIKSRKLLTEITTSTTMHGHAWYYGPASWQDHHGGGLWLRDGQGWFFVKNFSGIEWASQFCADAPKVEFLRQNAERLYAGFPGTEAELLKLAPDYPFKEILTTPIKTAADIDRWTDSIFNASVPLPAGHHTGVAPTGHGLHHYPTPIWDIEMFKRDDFVLWVNDDNGQPAAVVPVHPHGVDKDDPRYKNDYGKVAVAYATPGTALSQRLTKVEKTGGRLVADPSHPFAKAAFRNQ
jgi:hypothetical protein